LKILIFETPLVYQSFIINLGIIVKIFTEKTEGQLRITIELPILSLLKNENIEFEIKMKQDDNKNNEKIMDGDQDIVTKIKAKLMEFKIDGEIVNVSKGPVVDTYEWQLGYGEKVSRLTMVAEDLSLALSGVPIRMVYPMEGKTTVGIEVPNKARKIISLKEIISTWEFKQTNFQLPIVMGRDTSGELVLADLTSIPHLLVAGATGSGKSNFINSILVSLLTKKSPAEMKLILIDPKQLGIMEYKRLPHLIMPVITEANTAVASLLWLYKEMQRRYFIMSEFGVRNIKEFNVSALNTYKLPYIVLIIDEFADLILTNRGREIETHFCRLSAKAKAAGIHLIIGTLRPYIDVITGLIKSNFPNRVSFRVSSAIDSRTILNSMGAEKLLGKGDMFFKQVVGTTRMHAAYVEMDEVESLNKRLEDPAHSFNPEIIQFLLDNSREDRPEVDNATDDRYEQAVKVVLEHRSASASLLQRRLGIGYNRALILIEQMESRGVVGPAQGSIPRKILDGEKI
jgi:S-DNA-T family DNA segregation ATPase FtsK/SpoIIIE